MSTHGAARRPAGQELDVTGPDRIRNVVLVGPPGSGKTTLVDTLLAAAGAISRPGSVQEGSTVSDFDEAEHRHSRSVSLAVAPLVHDGVKVNLIDTPGYADFVGELRAGLRAADCALFVIAANEEVDATTRDLWRECAAVAMPRAVVITKLDLARADYDTVLLEAQDAFGEKVLPLYLPVRSEGRVEALAGLLSPSEHTDDAQRGTLIEAVIEESADETLMERYLGGEEVDEQILVADLERAVAAAHFHPVLPLCSATGVGARELLDLAVRAFPAPAEHPMPEVFTTAGGPGPALTCDPAGPLVAEVVKTTSDPYVGRVSLVRVFSGTLTPDVPLHVSGHFSSFFGESTGHPDHDEDARIGTLAHPFGAQQVATTRALAGDICAIGRLTQAETGDTLSTPEQPCVLRPWSLPEPLLPLAISARTKADDDKLSTALGRLTAEDPTLRVEHNTETGQLVIWALGEAHAEIALERLSGRFGVDVDPTPYVVSLRETFASPSRGHGRHVKQSGGHGQYAVCDVTVEPLPAGSGFEFVDKVVGGAVPRQFIASVEKGVAAQLAKGVRAGFPVVDVRVTLTDGKAHSVDSSDQAFQTAGALALKEAAAAGAVTLLEPYDTVTVRVPADLIGPVMSDLSARRGRLLGTDTTASEDAGSPEAAADGVREASPDATLIKAEVPQTELVRYAIELRSATHGAGTFTRAFSHYEPMPEEAFARAPR